jgi:hypothetical protein
VIAIIVNTATNFPNSTINNNSVSAKNSAMNAKIIVVGIQLMGTSSSASVTI